VPCIVRWPGKVPAGRVSDAIFATIDFLPTFASITGAGVPDDRRIDGVDQTGLLFGESEPGARDSFFYVRGYRKGKWKYLAAEHTLYGYSRDPDREIEEELYDLSVDLGETNNLADQYPEVVEELRRLMEEELGENDPEILKKIR
jgi:arylsulfatase A-like enzyme